MRLIILGSLVASMAFGHIFEELTPGEWYEIPNSQLEQVQPNPLPPNASGFDAVMDAWSGGAYDTKRERFIIWGGGHGDYSGNEIYVFDIETLKWERLTEPSEDVGGDERSGEYPDGTPRSRHTYDYIQYVPSCDMFCSFGGAAQYPTAMGTPKNHCFNFETNEWEPKNNVIGNGTGSTSAIDYATGKAWKLDAGNNADFASWDDETDTWTRHRSYSDGWLEYYYKAAVGHGKYIILGNGETRVFSIREPGTRSVSLNTTGDTEIENAQAPGFVFDPNSGYFVAWDGGADVYTLDLQEERWSKVTLASSNNVTPSSANSRGTYGRFQYVPKYKVFMGVNRTDENIYVFKPPAEFKAQPVSNKKPIKTGFKELPVQLQLNHSLKSQIWISVPDNSPPMEASVLDMSGQKLLSGVLREGHGLLSVDWDKKNPSLKPGFALLQIKAGNRVLALKKIALL